MTILTETLIRELIEQTRENLNRAEELKVLTDSELNWKSDPKEWSILECLEHLNRYGNFYLPVIHQKIKESTSIPGLNFKSGFLGNYFANSMLPKEKLNKMKTFKEMNPLNSALSRAVIDRFIQQQFNMIELLSDARRVNIEQVRVPISISKWIRLKLGDAFRFVIIHNVRHMYQIDRLKNDFALFSRESSTY